MPKYCGISGTVSALEVEAACITTAGGLTSVFNLDVDLESLSKNLYIDVCTLRRFLLPALAELEHLFYIFAATASS